MRGRYKKLIAKLPKNGWHCEINGYDFHRNTKGELEEAVAAYLSQYDIPGNAADYVEKTFCEENPDQCRWEE
jgi:hypothetical protein